VTAPRFATEHFVGSFRQKKPELGSLQLDNPFDEDVVKNLEARGHTVTTRRPSVAPVMLSIDASGTLRAAGDPKARRHAAAY